MSSVVRYLIFQKLSQIYLLQSKSLLLFHDCQKFQRLLMCLCKSNRQDCRSHNYAQNVLTYSVPNISGEVTPQASDRTLNFTSQSGAFYRTDLGKQAQLQWSGVTFNSAKLGFSAKNSNNLFGASTTLQPASCQILMIIKS